MTAASFPRPPLPLDELFRPRHIAVVGASTSAHGPGFIGGMQAMGFPGPLYPVNPKASEIAGLPCYPSLDDVPTDVDYVISSVPAHVVPELVEQAIRKQARLIHLFTAGFSETGDPERVELERHAIRRAVEHGIRVLGPNCMGLYIPRSHVSFMEDAPAEPGDVAMVSQSGANASEFVHRTADRRIRFSTVVSYGNGADLRDAELLEFAAEDADTAVIAMYIEGLRDGRAFLRALRRAAGKPVIVLKGGRTETGGRAARSHTGSLAGSIQVFDAACRQAGAVRVSGLDELVDLTVAFRYLKETPLPLGEHRGEGLHLGMVMSGGGTSVLAADDVASCGLDAPPLPEEARERLTKIIPIAGTSIRNPVDINMGHDPAKLDAVLEAVGDAPNVDVVYYQASFNWRQPGEGEERLQTLVEKLTKAREMVRKPFVVVAEAGREAEAVGLERRFTALCSERGFPVFPTPARAASALGKVLAWQRERALS